MKHGVKTIKNKFFLCKGCGGPWGIQTVTSENKYFKDLALTPSDKLLFQVGHRIVGTSSLVVT
jgi:hypothetical protein